MHPSKRKGDSAEREACALLHDLLGVDARRELGAGRLDDAGDVSGVPDATIQICSLGSASLVHVGLVLKPQEVERQRMIRGTTFAWTMVRIRGGTWRAVLTMDQLAVLYREATASLPLCWACKQVITTDPCIGPDGEEYHEQCCSVCVEGDE